ncbi:MAG: single-stranded DNA-binding protein [Candidatus Tyloplasma litorale]|nr:MAG: single-stranded DNA-binding protein [Mycoplasmatales bacterium]
MINKVILTGRLTSDVELRRTNDGTPYAFFTLAVNRRSQDQTDFVSCIAWRATAKLMHDYLSKGSLIGVEGRLEVFSQQKDGRYDKRTNVNIENVTFLEPKSNRNSKGFSNDNEMNNGQQPMTFSNEVNFDQEETSPIKKEKQEEFGKAEEIDASSINLEEIEF